MMVADCSLNSRPYHLEMKYTVRPLTLEIRG